MDNLAATCSFVHFLTHMVTEQCLNTPTWFIHWFVLINPMDKCMSTWQMWRRFCLYVCCCCLVLALHCTWMTGHRGVGGVDGNRLIWCYVRILKDSLSPLKHIVIILIGFSTQAETNAFLPIVFLSPEKLERNKRGRASQSGPIVAHTVTSRVC